MLELICGSIFDKKCDLIIIPCDHLGGLTRSVQNNIDISEILNVPLVNSPGEIVFEESQGDFLNASIIGFAATVNGFTHRSEKQYIHNICRDIKAYCRDKSLSLINIPLLGSGWGGLSIQESFELLRNEFENEKSAIYRIFVYSSNAYSTIKFEPDKNIGIKSPRVFISYTGTNPDNKKWVKNLTERLRENGVNARVDMFHLKLGQDLPQWMTNEILMADKVLLICDKNYVMKADSRNGGVGWETMIIQGDMMNNIQSTKYICIIREKNIDEGIPMYAKTKYSLHWTEWDIPNEGFKELLYCLFDYDNEPDMSQIFISE